MIISAATERELLPQFATLTIHSRTHTVVTWYEHIKSSIEGQSFYDPISQGRHNIKEIGDVTNMLVVLYLYKNADAFKGVQSVYIRYSGDFNKLWGIKLNMYLRDPKKFLDALSNSSYGEDIAMLFDHISEILA